MLDGAGLIGALFRVGIVEAADVSGFADVKAAKLIPVLLGGGALSSSLVSSTVVLDSAITLFSKSSALGAFFKLVDSTASPAPGKRDDSCCSTVSSLIAMKSFAFAGEVKAGTGKALASGDD